jgi:hypothetical protein
LVVLAEIVVGVAIPGRPYANMIGKIYGWVGMSHPLASFTYTDIQLSSRRFFTFKIRNSLITSMFLLEQLSELRC